MGAERLQRGPNRFQIGLRQGGGRAGHRDSDARAQAHAHMQRGRGAERGESARESARGARGQGESARDRGGERGERARERAKARGAEREREAESGSARAHMQRGSGAERGERQGERQGESARARSTGGERERERAREGEGGGAREGGGERERERGRSTGGERGEREGGMHPTPEAMTSMGWPFSTTPSTLGTHSRKFRPCLGLEVCLSPSCFEISRCQRRCSSGHPPSCFRGTQNSKKAAWQQLGARVTGTLGARFCGGFRTRNNPRPLTGI